MVIGGNPHGQHWLEAEEAQLLELFEASPVQGEIEVEIKVSEVSRDGMIEDSQKLRRILMSQHDTELSQVRKDIRL